MKYSQLYQKLTRSNFFVFSFNDLLRFFPGVSSPSLKVQICLWKKKGWLKALKRGVYKFAYPQEKVIPDLYVANRMYEPSYVSLETALSFYSLIPEVAVGVTSVTTKSTRVFKTDEGVFTFRSIKPALFTGYRIIREDKFEIRIAEPEKALLDYLYFKLRSKEEISDRFENKNLKKIDYKKIKKYAKLYPEEVERMLEKLEKYVKS